MHSVAEKAYWPMAEKKGKTRFRY